MYKNKANSNFSYKLEGSSMPSHSPSSSQLSFNTSFIQPLPSSLSTSSGWSQLGSLSKLPVLGVSPVLLHDNRTDWATEAGLGVTGSALCSGLGTGVHILSSLAGGAATVAGSIALSKVMPLPATATFASVGFSTSDLAGKYLGDLAQTACHSTALAAPKIMDSIQNIYHTSESLIDEKISGWQLSKALKQLDSKEAKEAADKHYLSSIHFEMIKTAMVEKNAALGSELFSEKYLIDLDKPFSLPVSNYLVKIGARCNRSTEADLRKAGANDIANICSKDSLPPDEMTKEQSLMFARIQLFKTEVLNDAAGPNPIIKNDCKLIHEALDSQKSGTSSMMLFTRAVGPSSTGLVNSATSYAIARGLVDQGYRCDVKEEQVLRAQGENYIANICSMPPLQQANPTARNSKKNSEKYLGNSAQSTDDTLLKSQFSNALKHLESKEVKKTVDKHFHLSFDAEILRDAILERNTDLGSEMFSGESLIHLDKPGSLPVTNYLVGIGSRCNRSAEADLRKAGANDIANLCSKDSLPPNEKSSQKSISAALKEVHPIPPHCGQDCTVLSDALKTESTGTSSTMLFITASKLNETGWRGKIMGSGVPGMLTQISGRGESVARGLVDQGYRCDVQEEKLLRAQDENYIANICSMPPVAQRNASSLYRKKN